MNGTSSLARLVDDKEWCVTEVELGGNAMDPPSAPKRSAFWQTSHPPDLVLSHPSHPPTRENLLAKALEVAVDEGQGAPFFILRVLLGRGV